jgi:hypothetical protein
MKNRPRVLVFTGRLLLFGASLSAMQWIWRLSTGLNQWQSHFQEVMDAATYQRYLLSPFVPLVLAGLSSMTLGLFPLQRTPLRLVGIVCALSPLLALLTPFGFEHDMGHCVLEECSHRLGEIHLWRCLWVAGAATVGAVLVGALAAPNAGSVDATSESGS